MRSTPTTFRLPLTLKEAASARAKEAGYTSVSEYVLGLLRFDLLTRKPHVTTANLSTLSRSEQDKVDTEIATMFETGETLGGTWFQHKVEDAVKAANAPLPEPSKLAKELLKRLNGKK